jgi:hypothetical protein
MQVMVDDDADADEESNCRDQLCMTNSSGDATNDKTVPDCPECPVHAERRT